MNEELERLVRDMITTARSRRGRPAAQTLLAIRDQITRAGQLGHGRYPLLLDDASAKEYESRAREWLAIVIRLSTETNTPWTAKTAHMGQHLIQQELAADWEEIFGRMKQILGQSQTVRMDQLDSSRDRSRASLEQEFALLILKQDRNRLPLSDLLAADRYRDVAEGWRKAYQLLDGQHVDLPNAAKEAVGAVETLACIVIADKRATLGEAIKVLRARSIIEAPLLKGLDELWGWASQKQGVRHSSNADTQAAEVRYCFRLAEAALHLLLAKDAA